MTAHAEGKFQVTSWEENTDEELGGGAKLTKARITQDFTGDLEATGTWEALMCYGQDGTASFLGYQRMAGRLGGRTGSFVLETNGTYDGKEAKTTWSVVPGSGTDELRDLRGSGTAVAGHEPPGSFTLDYDLG
jgi:Protein of unknown function (DUF3224)